MKKTAIEYDLYGVYTLVNQTAKTCPKLQTAQSKPLLALEQEEFIKELLRPCSDMCVVNMFTGGSCGEDAVDRVKEIYE